MSSPKEKAPPPSEFKTLPLNIQYGHRVIFKSMGFTSEELALPRIAIVNSWSEQSPGHSHLRSISEGVKAGIRMAGGMPFEINVIGPCSVLNAGPADMLFDLPQREAILASIESALHVGWCHGWVGIGSCDKIVPGMLLAALRLDRPFIFLGGGQMLPCDYEGQRFGYVRGMEIISQEFNKLKEGSLSPEDYERELESLTDCCGSSAGACGEMTTGNSMQLLTEALGFSLPGSSTSVAVSAEKIWQAKETGKRIVDLAKNEVKPSHIFTLESMKNAMAVEMAICGGTNSLVHLQSCAHEADINCTLDTWDEISRKVPALVAVAPSGPYVLYDMHKAGGVPVVMKKIEKYLDLSCPTVTGKTVGENFAGVKPVDSDVIRGLDNPVWPEGALAVLKGNLAPRGAVTRHTVVDNKDLLTAVFAAQTFDSYAEVMEAITSKKIKPRDAIVYRYQGPRGGPAMTECLGIIRALQANRIKDVAVITDGRFSGWTKGYLAIGNVCPEAQVGGPLAHVQKGDPIRVDVPNRTLDVDITEKEMARRKSKWSPPDQSKITGTLLMYATTALQADEGAGWPVRWSDLDRRS
jgi:dihydroxy-acid dehydratase